MTNVQEEISRLARGYLRKGGKENRRQQYQRMLEFGRFCEREGARSMAQVGARQVIRYWRSDAMLQLSDRTRQAHYYALRTLWELADKSTSPPVPFTSEQREVDKELQWGNNRPRALSSNGP